MKNMKSMAAKFPGTCAICHERIEVGEPILWESGKGARHAIHGEEAVALPKPEAKALDTVEVGDLAGVYELFEKARQHLKFPKVVLMLPSGGILKLSVAGPKAKKPGTINVTNGAAFGVGKWFGRILQSGTMEQGRRDQPTSEMIDLLRMFAKAPADTAAAFGKLTGKCCFCNTALTDEKSTDVGYGPVCAGHYGLPWGKAA